MPPPKPKPHPDAPKVKVRLVPEHIARALAKGKGAGIDSAKLLSALLDRWGGCDRFAQDIHGEFQQAKAGSMTRQRILEMISRLTVQVTSQEIAKPRSAREMSNAEILATARTLLERLDHGADPAAAPQPPRPGRAPLPPPDRPGP